MDHLPGLMAILAPSYNSYRRFHKGSWSGGEYLSYGTDNRESAVRIPSRYLGNEMGSVNIEVKPADNSANPYLAIGSMLSATTKNQIIAFVLTTAVCFLFTLAGSSVVLDFFSAWAPSEFVQAVGNFGFLPHFQSIQRGVIDLRDLFFFASIIVISLTANALIIDWRKAT